MCSNSTRRQEKHIHNAHYRPSPQTTAQLSTAAALSRLNLGRLYVAFVLTANVFMVMGAGFNTFTPCSDSISHCSLLSAAELCFCWILAFRHTRPSPPYHLFPRHASTDRLRTHPSGSTSPPFKSLFPLLRRHPPHPPPVRPPTPESD